MLADPRETWEGDTLVVETAGFNDRSWLDESGHAHSEELHVTERFRRVDFGHIQFQITFDDAKTLTRPLTRSLTLHYAADTDMLEYICNEGERDAAHYVGKTNGDLFFLGVPLIPRSQTRFDSAEGAVEFVTDAGGAVTHLILHAVEGVDRFERKR